MADKLTDNEEKYALSLAAGMTPSEAYKNVYSTGRLKPETVALKACLLCKKERVSRRCAQLKEKLRQEEETRESFSVGGTFENLRQLANISFTDERVQKGIVKAADILKANELIGKHLGMFKERNEPAADLDLAAALEAARKRAANAGK